MHRIARRFYLANVMDSQTFDRPTPDLENFVDVAAALVGLPLPPAYRPGVVENFERIQAIAQLVTEFPLPEDLEPASTFEP